MFVCAQQLRTSFRIKRIQFSGCTDLVLLCKWSTDVEQMRIAILLLAVIDTILCNFQSAKVEGYLTCDGKPAQGVTVKLYDDGVVYDTMMGSTKTDASGFFSVAGTSSGITNIDPKYNIYTDCNDGIKPCQRKITIYVPKSKISQSAVPTQTYQASTLELSGKFKGEKRDCIH